VQEVISKKEFAEYINVSAGRVSQYISEGKLSGLALDGTGRKAKIRVAEAVRQLKINLDLGQRLGNGSETNLTVPDTLGVNQEQERSTQPCELVTKSDVVTELLKAEKLAQARMKTRKDAAAEALASGTLVETKMVRAEMARMASQILQTFEGGLPDLANSISANFELSNRDVLHVLRDEFRKLRERAADTARKNSNYENETLETVLVTEDETEA
jgi:hypothetical protein